MTVNPVCIQNWKKNISHIAKFSVLKYIHMVKHVKKKKLFWKKKHFEKKNICVLMMFTGH